MSYKSVFYFFFTTAFLFLFFRSLRGEIAGSVAEQDLIWYIPNFTWQTQGLSGLALIQYLLSPSLWYMDPVTKSYFWLCHALFGLQIKYYICVTLCVHLCNALLVYALCRRVRLSFLTSYLSALSTLFFFAQFHAYMWPMAFQHIIVAFFMLLGFVLYLKTDELATAGHPFAKYWAMSLGVNILASFCRFNIIILPAMMLTHILFGSVNDSQKIKRLKTWLPVMAIYLGNPLYSLIGAGDNRAHIDLTAYSYWLILLIGLAAMTACFYLFKGYVRLKEVLPTHFEKYFILTSAGLAAGTIFLVRGFTNSIVAVLYATLIPLIACFKAFLEPLQIAQAGLSTFPYYLIPAHASITSFFLVAACLIYFISVAAKEFKPLLVLAVWYGMCFIFLVHQDPIRSRYFIFLAPLFSIMFCTISVRLADFFFSHIRSAHLQRLKTVSILLLFACLFTANIAAIQLTLFRGKLINALNSFEYLKAATLIKNDIQATPGLQVSPQQLVILNLPPAPFPAIDYNQITTEPTDRYFNGKAIFSQVFGDNRYFAVSFQAPPTAGTPVVTYTVNASRIEKNKLPIDPFFMNLEQGKQQLAAGQTTQARNTFAHAIGHKPFLFQYLLGNMALDNLRWITNDTSFIDWLEEMKRIIHLQDREPNADTQRVLADIQDEVDATIECLFYLAYLEGIAGDKEKEAYWMGQLKLLENSNDRLQMKLQANPFVASSVALKHYAQNLPSFMRYKDWRGHDLYYGYYLFEKFVLRLLKS